MIKIETDDIKDIKDINTATISIYVYIDVSAQDCSIFSALVPEIQLSCTKPSI